MRADREVRRAYTQVKTVLNLFRELALDHPETYTEICRLFDRTIANGSDMAVQSRLIAAAVHSITATFQQKLAFGLQDRREFILPLANKQLCQDDADLEHVTWLVLHYASSISPLSF